MASRFIHSSLAKSIVYVALLVSAGNEIFELIDGLGAHHGVLFYSILKLLELFETAYETAAVKAE